MPATLDDLFDEAKLPATMCANYREGDCVPVMEWCPDGKLRCDVHASIISVCPRCDTGHDTDLCVHCGVVIVLERGEWDHAEECPDDSSCWQGSKGATPRCTPVRRPLRETRPV